MPRSNRPRGRTGGHRDDEPDGLERLLAGWRRTEVRRGVEWNVQPVSAAQAQKRQAEYGLNASTDQARLELETAWTTLQAAAEVVATQQKALELARESVQIAQVSYENGVITSAELNDAQVRMLETEWTLLQAKYAKIVAAARAKVAAGVE